MQALSGKHIDQRTFGDLQILDKVEAAHFSASCRHLRQIPPARRSWPADAPGGVLQPMAREHPINSGQRRSCGHLGLQRYLDRLRPVLTENAFFTQAPAKFPDALLDAHRRTVPAARAARGAIRNVHPVQPTPGSARYPPRDCAHADVKPRSNLMHTLTQSYQAHHLSTSLLNA